MKRYLNYFINLICPAFVFGSVTGILISVIVTLYKVCAKYVIGLSETGYGYLRGHLWLVPAVLAVMFAIAAVYAHCYKKVPNLRGGGIPTSIGVLRGIITFRWLINLVGIFFLSLTTFLLGVPLGNEGPSVQMGTAVGKASVAPFVKRHKAWERYSMTGGACAGFSVATGAPISGIVFSIEEAHGRVSPMIIIVSCTSVMFSYITAEVLSPIFGVSTTLFPKLSPMSLSVRDVWIPVVIGIVVGLFAVLFLSYYRLITAFFNKKLKKIPHSVKIFFVFALTLAAGLCSFSFVSTGHELILSVFEGNTAIHLLLIILLVRSTLTMSANSNRITGGMFLPILAVGTVLSSVFAQTAERLFGLGEDYHMIILVLGITACISGMMKMPLTAIVFSVEALSGYDNILYIIVVAAVAFIITEIFDAKSINDTILDNRIEEFNEGKTMKVIDTFVTVQKGAFAIGKQIRDIFWPANLFVLSVRHDKTRSAEVDEHGGKAIREGDTLHVRYSTFDEHHTKEELTAIVGEQEYNESETDIV